MAGAEGAEGRADGFERSGEGGLDGASWASAPCLGEKRSYQKSLSRRGA